MRFFLVLWLCVSALSCTQVGTCSISTCPSGCCDAKGLCQDGTTTENCGSAAGACTACTLGQICKFGNCTSSFMGPSGGGSAAGGGSEADGGNQVGGGSAGGSQTGGGSDVGGGAAGGGTSSGGGVAAGGGGATGGGSGFDAGTPMSCSAQMNFCPQHGSCNLSLGKCECDQGFHLCGTQCVSSTDVATCGNACSPCAAAPANAVGICAVTGCDFTCNAGYRRCGTGCVPNASVTCGASCNSCPGTSNGSAICSGANCALQCNSGYLLCGGACAACPSASATSFACSGSQCVASACSSGSIVCNGSCATCPANASSTACQGSTCAATACSGTTHLCSGACKAATDINACGASCAVCPAGSGMTALCTQGRCDARCTGTTTCKGRCGSTCSWTQHSSSSAVEFVDVLVDAAGNTHAATTLNFRSRYHSIPTSGAPTTETVATANDCFESSGSSTTSAPFLINDPSSPGKPAIACARGNTMSGFNWDPGTSAWVTDSVFNSTSLNSSAYAISQSNGRGAFARYMPSSGGTSLLVNLIDRTATAWDIPLVEDVNQYTSISAMSLLKGTPGSERVAFRAAQVVNYQVVDAGTIHTLTYSNGSYQRTDQPWLVASAFGQEPDGTLVAVDGALNYFRLVNGAWTAQSLTSNTHGNVVSLQMLVDPAGTLRVAWSTSSGIWLASLYGGTWYVETVYSGSARSVRVSANASGKVAIGAVTSGGFIIFD